MVQCCLANRLSCSGAKCLVTTTHISDSVARLHGKISNRLITHGSAGNQHQVECFGIVADVLGVVCDFCALAMNKIFSKREEVAAIYVDLDTKALNLVLVPGASLSDQTIADLAVQAGYRIADVRRGDEALGTAT